MVGTILSTVVTVTELLVALGQVELVTIARKYIVLLILAVV